MVKHVAKRFHKERVVPRAHIRKGFTMLEKHKDYKLRADDYNKKKKYLKDLARKAALANEEEFSFGMINARKRRDGTHVSLIKDLPTNKEISRMKKQDHELVKMMIVQNRKQIDRLTVGLGLARKEDQPQVPEEREAGDSSSSSESEPEVDQRDEQAGDGEADEGMSDEDKPETTEEKLKRLRREVEELTVLSQKLDTYFLHEAKGAKRMDTNDAGQRVLVRKQQRRR
ncbi:Small-subunit processome Utp11 [Carpediemonas membranifera]|uniref:Small-subunit processome Utp11 n=1 Tax=Carpediemonas membranifera TaxID=201153 RepID=A0A8J6DZA9_9EUKA|nr:Small-subunit processome Utp11 [Carpediemonas membranifera]|eukprot:KAG9390176.1 Small-subunit processome Utp11 [Carpediemonas membranifera]